MKRDRRGNVIQPTTPILNKTLSSPSASAAEDLLTGEYEVFLSFRGVDTRDGFTDYLYNDLIGAGVRTFRDENDLRVGEEIGPELLRAIKGSKISIPIFSKNYAFSKWCLHEPVQMVECRANSGQMIYPIFYDVEPLEVHHYERGSYKEAFLEYEKSESSDEKTVQQWKAALEIVGELKGLELKKDTNGREGELVKIVVEKVLLKLKKNYQDVPKNLVGIDSHIEKMEGLLNCDSYGLRIIGILGMGGLGKTTIAKVIYNKLSELFERHCFLEDVREKSQQRNGLVDLQTQLLSQILNKEISNTGGVCEGLKRINDVVDGKKVLLVLDDVDGMSHIEKLVGNHNWYDARSRIIITTRNKEVLKKLKLTCQKEGLREVYASYKPDFMNHDYSVKLFSKYAFKEDSPPEGYDDLATGVVRTAGGLPLVLVTLGSLLFIEKDKVSWQEKLEKLQGIPPLEVLGRLRISYNALDNAQKQIFLDIACLFSGEDKTNPCYMWDDCKFYPREGINALARRSLMKVGDDNKLWMHGQLRELGKQIICEENWDEPGKWSRLWHSEDASNILKAHMGTKNVKVLCVYSSDLEEVEDSEKPLPRLVGQDFGKLPNLRYLKMDFIDLDGDFRNLLQNLRWLQWWQCLGNYAPTNFNLKILVVLDLTESKIKDDWGGWSQIKMAKKLKVLILSYCSELSRAPHLSAFPTLERLELEGCGLLSRLDGLEKLESLKYLNASCCSGLESLPDLSKLTKIQTLNVKFCQKLTAIQGIDKLESLELLGTSLCYSLQRLPNLSNLEKLTRFECSMCKNLVEIQGLGKLASLEQLDISGCKSLKRLPDLSNFKKLRTLRCEWLELTEVQGLGGLESLEHLNMNDMACIERLSDLSKLKWLRILDISSCGKLIEIQGLDKLESLEHLNIYECRSIKTLPDLSMLKRLKKLNISLCDELIKIQDLGGLESLEKLDMSYCQSLERLPDLSNLRKIKHLNMSSCHMLIEIQGLHKLESLEHLDMSYCTSIEILPDLPNVGNLKQISLHFCTELRDVETLRVVESLESLDVSYCKLQNMPDLAILKKLKKLDIGYLEELTELQGLEELKSLELLDVRGCKSIESLPDFSNLTNLKELDVSYCVKLTEIRGLEKLKPLMKSGFFGVT